MSELGVGLIGTGYMGKCHALAFTQVHAVFGDGPVIRLAHLRQIAADEVEMTAGLQPRAVDDG